MDYVLYIIEKEEVYGYCLQAHKHNKWQVLYRKISKLQEPDVCTQKG